MTPLEFRNLHMAALERDEARHNVMLAILGSMADDRPSNVMTWSLGLPGQCAVKTPGKPILLADLDDAQCGALAEETAGLDYPGVVGPDRTAHGFARRAAELGVAFGEPIPKRIHSLMEKPNYPGVPGYARRPAAADAGMLADWIASFIREATPHDVVPSRERLAALAAEGRHLFWIVDDEPVSMAAIVRQTRSGAAIAFVYTPPSLRGKGYAGSVTAAVVEQAFAEGKTMACLYTSLSNPFSNRCYARIGFKAVCDAAHIPTVASSPSAGGMSALPA
jgi:RimJ/RimL family protein N-acetyltransferase